MTSSHPPHPVRGPRRLLVAGLVLVAAMAAGWIVTGAARAQAASSQATSAAPVAPAAPQPKPLLILNINGKIFVLKARAIRPRGDVLTVEPLQGPAQNVAAAALINQLSWYTDPEMESGRVDLNALTVRYRALASAYPPARSILAAEAQRFQDIAGRFTTKTAQRSAETQKRVADILGLKFDPAAGQSRDEVAAVVRESDELARLVPAQAAQITKAAAAPRDALARLDAGQVFHENHWVSAVELASRRKEQEEAAIQHSFDQTLPLPLPAQILGPGQVFAMIGLPLLVLLIIFLYGLGMMLGRQRGLGFFAVAVAFALGGMGYHLLAQDNRGSFPLPRANSADTIARSNRVAALLFRATTPSAAPQAEDRDSRLSNADLSSFLARNVQISPDAGSSLGLRTSGLAVGVTREGFVLLEPATLAGVPISLRYDVRIDAHGESPVVKSYSIRAGGLPVPDPVKSFLWSRLGPTLGNYIGKLSVLEACALTDMGRGEIRIASARAIGTRVPGRPAKVPANDGTPGASPGPAPESPSASPAPPANEPGDST